MSEPKVDAFKVDALTIAKEITVAIICRTNLPLINKGDEPGVAAGQIFKAVLDQVTKAIDEMQPLSVQEVVERATTEKAKRERNKRTE